MEQSVSTRNVQGFWVALGCAGLMGVSACQPTPTGSTKSAVSCVSANPVKVKDMAAAFTDQELTYEQACRALDARQTFDAYVETMRSDHSGAYVRAVFDAQSPDRSYFVVKPGTQDRVPQPRVGYLVERVAASVAERKRRATAIKRHLGQIGGVKAVGVTIDPQSGLIDTTLYGLGRNSQPIPWPQVVDKLQEAGEHAAAGELQKAAAGDPQAAGFVLKSVRIGSGEVVVRPARG